MWCIVIILYDRIPILLIDQSVDQVIVFLLLLIMKIMIVIIICRSWIDFVSWKHSVTRVWIILNLSIFYCDINVVDLPNSRFVLNVDRSVRLLPLSAIMPSEKLKENKRWDIYDDKLICQQRIQQMHQN